MPTPSMSTPAPMLPAQQLLLDCPRDIARLGHLDALCPGPPPVLEQLPKRREIRHSPIGRHLTRVVQFVPEKRGQVVLGPAEAIQFDEQPAQAGARRRPEDTRRY